jgi:hypothetical protein
MLGIIISPLSASNAQRSAKVAKVLAPMNVLNVLKESLFGMASVSLVHEMSISIQHLPSAIDAIQVVILVSVQEEQIV